MLDPFHIPPSAKHPWMDYQWISKTPESAFAERIVNGNWEKVPFVRFAHLPQSELWTKNSDTIEYGGLVLMNRPDHFTMVERAKVRRKSYELEYGEPYRVVVQPTSRWRRIVNWFRNKNKKACNVER